MKTHCFPQGMGDGRGGRQRHGQRWLGGESNDTRSANMKMVVAYQRPKSTSHWHREVYLQCLPVKVRHGTKELCVCAVLCSGQAIGVRVSEQRVPFQEVSKARKKKKKKPPPDPQFKCVIVCLCPRHHHPVILCHSVSKWKLWFRKHFRVRKLCGFFGSRKQYDFQVHDEEDTELLCCARYKHRVEAPKYTRNQIG